MYQALVFGIGAVIIALTLILTRKNPNTRLLVLKIITVVFCAVGFFRFFLSDSIVLMINGDFEGVKYYNEADPMQLILRWGYYTNYAVLPMAVFFKSRFFRNIAVYFSLPFTVLTTIFFGSHMEYFLDPSGLGYHFNPAFRYAYFVAELVLAFAIPLILAIGERHLFNVRDGREWLRFGFGVPAVLLAMLPVYIIPTMVEQTTDVPPMFSAYHFVWIGATLVLTLALYYGFRFTSYDTRYMLCVFLTLALFFHYNSFYLIGVRLNRLPFDLCNIAAYFYMFAVIFKWKKFFHFCFIANIVGTLFAIIGPDFGAGFASFKTIHFLVQHTYVLIIPVLCMGLKIFPRLSGRSLLPWSIGFTGYITFCYVLGTILNGYSDVTGTTVNYFYMFDLNTAFEYFEFLTPIKQYKYVLFDRFVIYPLVPLIVFVGFGALCLLFYLITRGIYKIEDDHLELNRSGVDLFEKITKKKSRIPKDFKD